MTLSTQEQILVEQRVTNDAKSTGAAYLLWFFFGGIGAHRFYLGQTASGVAMPGLLVVGFATLTMGVGFFFLALLAIWAFVDLFLIPSMVAAHKNTMRSIHANSLLSSPRS